jgi:hypothetical protein
MVTIFSGGWANSGLQSPAPVANPAPAWISWRLVIFMAVLVRE